MLLFLGGDIGMCDGLKVRISQSLDAYPIGSIFLFQYFVLVQYHFLRASLEPKNNHQKSDCVGNLVKHQNNNMQRVCTRKSQIGSNILMELHIFGSLQVALCLSECNQVKDHRCTLIGPLLHSILFSIYMIYRLYTSLLIESGFNFAL